MMMLMLMHRYFSVCYVRSGEWRVESFGCGFWRFRFRFVLFFF